MRKETKGKDEAIRCCKKCHKKLPKGYKHSCCEACRNNHVSFAKRVLKMSAAVGVVALTVVTAPVIAGKFIVKK